MLLDELKSKSGLIHQMAREHGARQFRVFGSVARREKKPDSDIDLVVDLPRGYDMLFQRVRLTQKLSELTGRRVELVPNRRIRNQVLAEAVEI
ncbi:MAG: nucleotidyltransferase [Gammaproteobacteria bacterium]|jgi:predicted nucleotidyltransferase|nr:nucleotidyltransferase [Gammaproteobacteria bacterium]